MNRFTSFSVLLSFSLSFFPTVLNRASIESSLPPPDIADIVVLLVLVVGVLLLDLVKLQMISCV